MSLSQFLKDYIESFNNFYDNCSGHITILPFIQFTLVYLAQCIWFLIKYIITCRWLIDFCSIKIVLPEAMYSNLLDEYCLETPLFRFFNFFEVGNKLHNPYLEGILNSFFYCLPFSTGNILWLRRLTIEGIPGGIVAVLGIISAQFLILLGILFGFRLLIFSWLSYELVHYFASIVLIFFLIERIAIKPLMRVKVKETNKLSKIFLFHFGFALTEQTTFLPYLSNLSFTSAPLLFEGFNMGKGVDSISIFFNPIFANLIYFFSILFGMFFWYSTFGVFFIWLGNVSTKLFSFSYSRWVRGVHRSSIILLITITITSLPYYSGDFLMTSPFGFIQHDEAAKKFRIKTISGDLPKGRLGELSIHSSLDTDPSPFDHGRYTTGKEVEMTFEDLNYQGEYIWRTRNDRLSIGSKGLVNKWLRKLVPLFERKSKAKREKAKTVVPIPIPKKPDNDWESFDTYSTIEPIYATQEKMVERFVQDYQSNISFASFPDKGAGEILYVPFGEISKYGFEAFPNTMEQETDEFERSLGKRVKTKYVSNYVYRNFLNLNISLLLNRQSRKKLVNGEDENSLFKKRQVLANYYDSIREYSKIPYYRPYINLFIGTKSYANRVYNQQFKGTLKIVKRLFSVTLENSQNLFENSVLKFDQPLYTPKNNEKKRIIHEELVKRISRKRRSRSRSRRRKKRQKPFLEESNPMPFYAGWDNELRKFFVTNFMLSHSKSSIATSFYNKSNYKFQSLYFLTWPIPDSKIDNKKREIKPPLNLFFNVYDDPAYPQERDLFEYPIEEKLELVSETLPSTIRRIDVREREKILKPIHPLRGGYVWANNDAFRIPLKDDLIEYLPPDLRKIIRILQRKKT